MCQSSTNTFDSLLARADDVVTVRVLGTEALTEPVVTCQGDVLSSTADSALLLNWTSADFVVAVTDVNGPLNCSVDTTDLAGQAVQELFLDQAECQVVIGGQPHSTTSTEGPSHLPGLLPAHAIGLLRSISNCPVPPHMPPPAHHAPSPRCPHAPSSLT